MTGQNGGAAFILIYLGCVVLLGIPCMISEFIIGRHGAANTYRSYANMAKGKAWKYVGLLGVLTGFLITGYYAVVAGWCLQYIYASTMGQLNGTPDYITRYFDNFSQNPFTPVFWTVFILLLTHLIIMRGVKNGIEKASKLFMPTLFILLIVIVIASCLLPNAGTGMAFLLRPDFSKINASVFISALGQAFYSLSIAMGCACTYASYYSRKTNLQTSAVQVAAVDTLVCILAGLMIFPAAFSVGVNPGSGPSLIFITLPNVFNQAFASFAALGQFVSVLFYALLSLAALTSLISLHEVSTAFLHEELHVSRPKGAAIVTISTIVMGIFCALSLGEMNYLQAWGKSLFDLFDFVTGQLFLPLGGFLTCLFVGWYVPKQLIKAEFTNNQSLSARYFGLYHFAIRYICPTAILAIFLHQFGLL